MHPNIQFVQLPPNATAQQGLPQQQQTTTYYIHQHTQLPGSAMMTLQVHSPPQVNLSPHNPHLAPTMILDSSQPTQMHFSFPPQQQQMVSYATVQQQPQQHMMAQQPPLAPSHVPQSHQQQPQMYGSNPQVIYVSSQPASVSDAPLAPPPQQQQQLWQPGGMQVLPQQSQQYMPVQQPSPYSVGLPVMAPLLDAPQMFSYAAAQRMGDSVASSATMFNSSVVAPPHLPLQLDAQSRPFGAMFPQPQFSSIPHAPLAFAGAVHMNAMPAAHSLPTYEAAVGSMKSTSLPASSSSASNGAHHTSHSGTPKNPPLRIHTALYGGAGIGSGTPSPAANPSNISPHTLINSEGRPVCRHFIEGKCNRRKCRFPHDMDVHQSTPSDAPLQSPDANTTAPFLMQNQLAKLAVSNDGDEDVPVLNITSSGIA